MMAACTQNKNPFLQEWDTPYGIPPFDKIQLSEYIPAVKAGIKQQKAELDAILNNPEAPTFKNTIAAYELSGDILDKVSNVLFNLQETEGSDEMNKIVEQENITCTDEELDAKIKELAEQSNKSFEEYKANMNPRQKDYIKDMVVTDNMFKFLRDNNKIG